MRLRKIAILLAVVAAAAFQMPSAYAGDGPRGFYWGTDSGGPAPSSSGTCSSSSVPWLEPNVVRYGCGRYGGYFGKIGSFSALKPSPCVNHQLWNDTAANRANANARAGYGIGAVPFWLGGGPGADPKFDGTTGEAYDWGKRQGRKALILADKFPVRTNIMFFDIEEPNHANVPNSYYGWNEKVKAGTCASLGDPKACCSPALARATFNGFWDYVVHHSYNGHHYRPGVYSSAYTWNSIFGTSPDGILKNTLEWTANWGQGCLNPAPYEWIQAGGACASNQAQFFGGVTKNSPCALAWQWHGGNQDYVQIDSNRAHNKCL